MSALSTAPLDLVFGLAAIENSSVFEMISVFEITFGFEMKKSGLVYSKISYMFLRGSPGTLNPGKTVQVVKAYRGA